MILLKVINKKTNIPLYRASIISFTPNIIIKIKRVNGLRLLLTNSNYSMYEKTSR